MIVDYIRNTENDFKDLKMGYEKSDAQITGKLGEKEAQQALRNYGLIPHPPGGKDIGIDLIAYFPERPNSFATIQVKGRRKIDTPRWFQATVPKSMLQHYYDTGLNLEQTWRDRIKQVDFWFLVSIPLNEIWVFPSDKTLELAELNIPHYKTRRDNQFDVLEYDKRGKVKKKQKELNLHKSDANGVILADRFKFYLNNFDLVSEFLKN